MSTFDKIVNKLEIFFDDLCALADIFREDFLFSVGGRGQLNTNCLRDLKKGLVMFN